MTIRAETEVTLTRVNDGDNGVKVYDGTAGSVVTVSNASAYPALELVTDIEPIQPNDYSSVWVAGAGKNLLDARIAANVNTGKGNTWAVNGDGSISTSGTTTSNSYVYITNNGSNFTLPSGTYTYSALKADGTALTDLRINCGVWVNGSYTAFSGGASTNGKKTFTHDGNGNLQFVLEILSGKSPSGTVWIQVESGSTATAWTPYENICPIYGHDHCDVVVSPTLLDTDGTTYTTNFPQVVYGGTLDVVEGTLTVTYALMTFDGTQTFTDRISAQNRVYLQLGGMASQSGLNDDMVLCNALPKATGVQNADHPCIAVGVNNAYVYIQGVTHISGVTNLATLNTWLSNNPITFTYKLATPIVYNVSPKDIELISGTCNVWATTGDITDFRYAEISSDTLETFGDARKVAVKYVTDMGDDGIIVHPENDTSNYAKINAEGMDIVKGNDSVAFYGEFSRVGRDNRARTITSPKGVSMYTDDNVLAFSIGSSVNTGSVSVNEWVNYYATLNTSSTLTVPGLSQGAVGGSIQLGVTASYYDYNSVPNRQKTETNENIYFAVGTASTITWTVGASNNYTITIVYDGATSFTITNDIPITEQNYIRVAFVEYDKIDIIADVKLGSKTLSDGVWYTEARVVLWENESPKSNFSAQTVSLGAVEQFNYCDELEITFINSVSGLRYGSARGPIDRVNYSDTHTILSQGAQTKLYSREVYFNYVGQVVFSNGNYDGTNGAQYCVPQQIIGIRHI